MTKGNSDDARSAHAQDHDHGHPYGLNVSEAADLSRRAPLSRAEALGPRELPSVTTFNGLRSSPFEPPSYGISNLEEFLGKSAC